MCSPRSESPSPRPKPNRHYNSLSPYEVLPMAYSSFLLELVSLLDGFGFD
jgi:hypothetical protein